MIKRIAVIELYYHHEVVQQFLDLLSTAKVDLTLITLSEIHSYLELEEDQRIETHVFAHRQAAFHFLNANTWEADLCIMTTIAQDYKQWSQMRWPCPSLLLVHNWYAFTQPLNHLRLKQHFSLSLAMKSFYKILLQREAYYKKKLLAQVDFIAPFAIQQSHVDHLADRASRSYIEPLSLLYEKVVKPKPKRHELFTILVPGRVEAKSKDLACLEHFLEHLLRSPIGAEVRVVLMGKVGAALQNRISQWKQKAKSIQLKEGYLTTVAYQECIQQADLLFLPLKAACPYSIYVEKMGQSKASGTISDAIHWTKPALIPSFYPKPRGFENLFFHYDKGDWSATIQQIIELKNKTQGFPKTNLWSKKQASAQLLYRLNLLLADAQ